MNMDLKRLEGRKDYELKFLQNKTGNNNTINLELPQKLVQKTSPEPAYEDAQKES